MFNRNSLVAVLSAVGLMALSGAALAQQVVVSGGATLPEKLYNDEITNFPEASFKPYKGVGSGAGKTAFLTNNATGFGSSGVVHWIGSDSILTQTQINDYLTTGLGKIGNPVGHGPLIQIPSVATPVTVSYKGPTGVITLNKAQVCGIFSGKFTKWSQVGVTVPANLNDFKVVYRSDSSGTTELLTRHLQAVCGADSNVAFSGKSTFAQEFPSNTPPATFLPANGSGGVATVIGGQTSAITYLSPDPAYTGTLKQANLRNSNDNVVYSPTADDVNLALQNSGSGGLPGSAPTVTNPAATGWNDVNNAGNPFNWIRASVNPTKGYPIAGPTNLVLSQCYTSAAVANDVKDFLTKHYDAGNLLPGDHLLVALSQDTRDAILNTFVTGDAKNLNIGNTTVCGSYAGRG
ncbi:substrate-binding domain-containing protein [Achromobacter sp. AONIH1]|uniref:substrate-binding domain-containing protein n=1 Tax=Achromobacter sp. AONIH1 TaxID=1758194 RepID=UPI000CD0A897|nr:substrate-binding domain-containing protein [Achromobacter sp. AONIH1]AUT48165.1 ABC transporter substrate-binding protein [Achromobacter sp. AONIH1]